MFRRMSERVKLVEKILKFIPLKFNREENKRVFKALILLFVEFC